MLRSQPTAWTVTQPKYFFFSSRLQSFNLPSILLVLDCVVLLISMEYCCFISFNVSLIPCVCRELWVYFNLWTVLILLLLLFFLSGDHQTSGGDHPKRSLSPQPSLICNHSWQLMLGLLNPLKGWTSHYIELESRLIQKETHGIGNLKSKKRRCAGGYAGKYT